ncbi:MAG: TRAP transporter large permease subunit [Pseudomonadota bacterium]
MQSSYLTPPVALLIFYLRSIAPRDMTYGQMYRGVLPAVGTQMLVLVVIILIPEVATWLPVMLVGL